LLMMKRLQIAACAIRKEGGVEIKENFLCKLQRKVQSLL